MLGLHLYVSDNNDFYPPNPDDGNTKPGYNWCPGSAGIGEANEFNSDILLDADYSLLIGYLSKNSSVFKCPADKREGKYQGTDSALSGHIVPAARTFSMSQAFGTIDPQYDQAGFSGMGNNSVHSGIPNLSVNGPWLANGSGYGSNHRDDPWHTYGKASNIAAPGPSMLWVFVDEDANGLNDAAFGFGMETAHWIDAPGTYHNGGCGFAFADGHSETHQWIYRSEKIKLADVADDNDEKDWEWMALHTSAKAK